MAGAVSLRDAYGKTLVELGRENPDIVMLDADLCRSTMTQFFAGEFPERSFDCGIAEQNMIGIAAGLAAAGKIPYCARDCPNFPCALFERRFPRCWSQMGVNHHQAALLNNKTRTWSPILASPLEVKKADRDRLRVFCLGPFRVCRGLTEIQDRVT